ncbi:MAG: inositol monophosphatase [Planctomycetales bacterium]|nr:inositol monophosphatase [Planctomycetales bacterium]
MVKGPDVLNCPDSPELRVAIEAARIGSEIVLHYFHLGAEIRSKPGEQTYNLVSDADIQSEKAIAAFIRSQFATHAILGEEEQVADTRAEHLWIVDPLDGTNNFAHRIPHFAVSVAYYHCGEPQVGVVFNPVREDWYWARRGYGAYHNGRRMQVSPATRLSESMIGVGFYYDRGAMMQATLNAIHDFFKCEIHGIRRFGTAALDLCHVADGLYGAYFEYQLAPWDFAAGQLIVREAGGCVSDGRGQELPLTKSSLLASNGTLHSAAQEIVKRHHLD